LIRDRSGRWSYLKAGAGGIVAVRANIIAAQWNLMSQVELPRINFDEQCSVVDSSDNRAAFKRPRLPVEEPLSWYDGGPADQMNIVLVNGWQRLRRRLANQPKVVC
jgi:hypothetical protein